MQRPEDLIPRDAEHLPSDDDMFAPGSGYEPTAALSGGLRWASDDLDGSEPVPGPVDGPLATSGPDDVRRRQMADEMKRSPRYERRPDETDATEESPAAPEARMEHEGDLPGELGPDAGPSSRVR